jgi:hypothetical protein
MHSEEIFYKRLQTAHLLGRCLHKARPSASKKSDLSPAVKKFSGLSSLSGVDLEKADSELAT